MRPSPVMLAILLLAASVTAAIVAPASATEERGRTDLARMDAKPARLGAVGAAVTSSAAGETLAASGCKSVDTFTSSAVPALQKDGCLGCHSGASASAKGALDLSAVGANNAAACAQALAKVNLANKAQSAIIQAPTGVQAHLGGKVADGPAFTAAMLLWINRE